MMPRQHRTTRNSSIQPRASDAGPGPAMDDDTDEEVLRTKVTLGLRIGDIAASFVNLSWRSADDRIINALRALVRLMALDHGAFYCESNGVLRLSHSWPVADSWATGEFSRSPLRLSWLGERLRREQLIVISDPADLPEEASVESEFFSRRGLK